MAWITGWKGSKHTTPVIVWGSRTWTTTSDSKARNFHQLLPNPTCVRNTWRSREAADIMYTWIMSTCSSTNMHLEQQKEATPRTWEQKARTSVDFTQTQANEVDTSCIPTVPAATAVGRAERQTCSSNMDLNRTELTRVSATYRRWQQYYKLKSRAITQLVVALRSNDAGCRRPKTCSVATSAWCSAWLHRLQLVGWKSHHLGD